MASVSPQTEAEMEDVEEMEDVPTDASEQTTQETTEGASPAILTINADEIEEESPPLTYIDFLPQCFGVSIEGAEPKYAEFQSLVEQANQWLRGMPKFNAVKCETVDHKLNMPDYSLDPDQCLQHFSSHGKNIYMKGLRLWLMPKTDTSVPTQQLAYITVLPQHTSGNLAAGLSNVKPAAMRVNPEQIFASFDTLPVTVEKLNHHLAQKPLPGKILSVETIALKALESDRDEEVNTEKTLWSEVGKANRVFLFATRIFYVVGQPAFDRVAYYDQVPEFYQSPDGMGIRVRFAPFSRTVAQAALWLKAQHNTRVVNFQSVTLKTERQGGTGTFKVDPKSAGFTETQALTESRYVKILRVFYIKDQKPDAPALYSSTQLTTRLFVPTKTVAYSRSFETFSKNMQRVITWLNATGTPVLGMETVRYNVTPESEAGVNDDRVDTVINSHSGQYNLSCVRLYFASEFKEPPPEVMGETAEDAWGWGCVVS
ncbi:uncharacterized protein [Littorina saxatilis]|uniref:Uncharacterized protein n=3 Tax=Littorina saxatilis TaxID=31220 RepID=A0AAN9AYZ6_9CAEN